jgi:hypothetical protein
MVSRLTQKRQDRIFLDPFGTADAADLYRFSQQRQPFQNIDFLVVSLDTIGSIMNQKHLGSQMSELMAVRSFCTNANCLNYGKVNVGNVIS